MGKRAALKAWCVQVRGEAYDGGALYAAVSRGAARYMAYLDAKDVYRGVVTYRINGIGAGMRRVEVATPGAGGAGHSLYARVAPTVALAICRAALAALAGEKEANDG